MGAVAYICGDCGAENTLKAGDVIRCRCGGPAGLNLDLHSVY